jgi:hypothetical protein
MSQFLKNLAITQAKRKHGYVVPLVDERLMMGDNSEDRRDKMFHPSDLSGQFCPRAWSLYNFHPDGYAVKEGAVEPRLQRIFDNGTFFHSRLQRYLDGHLWGSWKRVIGVDRETGEQVYEWEHETWRPAGVGWVYAEVQLRHGPDRVAGHTDGLFGLSGKSGMEKWGLEGKSIKAENFRFLVDQPLRSHREQVLWYMHCLEHMRQERLRDAQAQGYTTSAFAAYPLAGFVVVYENKNDQTMKEFAVPYDADEVEAYVASKRPRMADALEFERTGRHPACRCPMGKESALCKAFPSA